MTPALAAGFVAVVSIIAAVVAAETRKSSMKVTAFEILAHHLADDGTPAAVLLLIPMVIDALELLAIVFHQRI